MASTAEILKRLSALDIPANALREVMSIIADVQACDEDRKRKDRERKRAKSSTPNGEASNVVSAEFPRKEGGNGAEIPPETSPKSTPLACAVFIGEELDIPPEKPTASTPKGAAGRSDRGTRLAEDWEPSEADRQFARERLPSSNACREELAKFREHFLAKPGNAARKLDWSLTWRKWVRTAAERLPPRAQGPPRRDGRLSPMMNAYKELYNECPDANEETAGEPSWPDASGGGGRVVGRVGGDR